MKNNNYQSATIAARHQLLRAQVVRGQRPRTRFRLKAWISVLSIVGCAVLLLAAALWRQGFHLLEAGLIGSSLACIVAFLYVLNRYFVESSLWQNQRAALAVSEEERRLHELFDLMPQLGWTARPDGFIDFYNKGWYEYTGTTYEQMEGWGWQSVHDQNRLPDVVERWRYSLDTGTPFEMEFPIRRADGVFRRFLTRVNPVLDTDAKIVRWVGINTDIDERAAELAVINARLKATEARLNIDISEAKCVEEEMRKAKEFSDALFQSVPNAIFVVDPGGQICSLNAAAEELFGYKAEELLGKPVEVLMPARLRERHVGHRQAYAHNPQKREMGSGLDLRAQKKDGSEFPVDIMISPVTSDGKGMTIAVVRDLSEQRKLEAERKTADTMLREQDATLNTVSLDPVLVRQAKGASVFLTMLVAIVAGVILIGCVFHIDWLRNPTPWGTYTKTNAAFGMLLSGSAMLIARSNRSFPKAVSMVLAAIAVGVGTITLGEWLFGWNAGIDQLIAADALIREHTAPGRMPSSSAAGLLFLGCGLLALNLRRISLAQVFALLTLGVGLITLSGHTYGFAELLSFGTSTLIAFPTSIMLVLAGVGLFLAQPETGPAQVIASTSLGGKVARRLLPLVLLVPGIGALGGMGTNQPTELLLLTCLSTALFPIMVWLAARTIDHLDRQKDQALARAFARREELEASNRQLEEARDQALQASHLKSAFVATISHELRTPLSAIIGTNDVLLGSNVLDPESAELLNGAQGAAQTLKTLVNDLLDLAKIESGKFALEQVSFSPAALVQESVSLCKEAARAKNLALAVNLSPDLPDNIMGDPGRTRQVLLNLINNAIKFTPSGAVSVDVTQQSGDGRDLSITFAIKDSGIGVSAEDQKRLFLPFSQVDSSATRQYGGAGLGLSLSKGLVELMGGTIGVNSKAAEGAVFCFTIPMRLSPPTPMAAVASAPAAIVEAYRNKLALVVEDNLVVQRIVVKQLSQLGLKVLVASTGQDALDRARDNHFDLIFMDCNLPDISGLDVTRGIRQAENGHPDHVPIVAMTAAAMKGDREQCINAGMDDYLSKPVSINQLRETLAKWLPA